MHDGGYRDKIGKTKMIMTSDTKAKPVLMSFKSFEQTLSDNFGITLVLEKSEKNTVLVWTGNEFNFFLSTQKCKLSLTKHRLC